MINCSWPSLYHHTKTCACCYHKVVICVFSDEHVQCHIYYVPHSCVVCTTYTVVTVEVFIQVSYIHNMCTHCECECSFRCHTYVICTHILNVNVTLYCCFQRLPNCLSFTINNILLNIMSLHMYMSSMRACLWYAGHTVYYSYLHVTCI